jgi:hypothetical protein
MKPASTLIHLIDLSAAVFRRAGCEFFAFMDMPATTTSQRCRPNFFTFRTEGGNPTLYVIIIPAPFWSSVRTVRSLCSAKVHFGHGSPV